VDSPQCWRRDLAKPTLPNYLFAQKNAADLRVPSGASADVTLRACWRSGPRSRSGAWARGGPLDACRAGRTGDPTQRSSTPPWAARTCPDFWTLSSLIVCAGPPAPVFPGSPAAFRHPPAQSRLTEHPLSGVPCSLFYLCANSNSVRWWRRRESNPRPEKISVGRLRA
jgi:hypothetical protein